MNKLAKLLTPILTVGAVATPFVALTSCNSKKTSQTIEYTLSWSADKGGYVTTTTDPTGVQPLNVYLERTNKYILTIDSLDHDISQLELVADGAVVTDIKLAAESCYHGDNVVSTGGTGSNKIYWDTITADSQSFVITISVSKDVTALIRIS